MAPKYRILSLRICKFLIALPVIGSLIILAKTSVSLLDDYEIDIVESQQLQLSLDTSNQSPTSEKYEADFDRIQEDGVDSENRNEKYIKEFDYTLPAIPNKFTVPLPSTINNQTQMAILVLSERSNFDRRKAVRKTWGEGHADIFFVIGGSQSSKYMHKQQWQEEKTQGSQEEITEYDALMKEQERHNDIIDSIHWESYRSLPYKLKFGFHYVLKNFPNIKWIVKVDDDTVVRVDTLQKYYLNRYNPNIPMVIGRIIQNSPVQKDGKWMEDPKFKQSTYPNWPQGSCGYVVSKPIAEYIANTDDLYYYQGEDVSLGIWLDEMTLPNDIIKNDKHITWVSSKAFVNEGDCYNRESVIIGHQISEEQMIKCYSQGRNDEVSHKDAVWVEGKTTKDYYTLGGG